MALVHVELVGYFHGCMEVHEYTHMASYLCIYSEPSLPVSTSCTIASTRFGLITTTVLPVFVVVFITTLIILIIFIIAFVLRRSKALLTNGDAHEAQSLEMRDSPYPHHTEEMEMEICSAYGFRVSRR